MKYTDEEKTLAKIECLANIIAREAKERIRLSKKDVEHLYQWKEIERFVMPLEKIKASAIIQEYKPSNWGEDNRERQWRETCEAHSLHYKREVFKGIKNIWFYSTPLSKTVCLYICREGDFLLRMTDENRRGKNENNLDPVVYSLNKHEDWQFDTLHVIELDKFERSLLKEYCPNALFLYANKYDMDRCRGVVFSEELRGRKVMRNIEAIYFHDSKEYLASHIDSRKSIKTFCVEGLAGKYSKEDGLLERVIYLERKADKEYFVNKMLSLLDDDTRILHLQGFNDFEKRLIGSLCVGSSCNGSVFEVVRAR